MADNGNDSVDGGGGNDSIYGGLGNDTLKGGSGDDLLSSGSGADVLTGGSGRDVFVLDGGLNGGVVTITDFSVGEDKIQLSRSLFAGFGSSVSLATQGTPTSGGAQMIYNNGTGDLYYDADGLGGGAAIKVAHLALGLSNLSASDFLLI